MKLLPINCELNCLGLDSIWVILVLECEWKGNLVRLRVLSGCDFEGAQGLTKPIGSMKDTYLSLKKRWLVKRRLFVKF